MSLLMSNIASTSLFFIKAVLQSCQPGLQNDTSFAACPSCLGMLHRAVPNRRQAHVSHVRSGGSRSNVRSTFSKGEQVSRQGCT